jgi:Flp pilus assembly protein TadB
MASIPRNHASRRAATSPIIIVMDQSPAEIEPHQVDEEDEDDDERASNCRGFGVPLVGILWLVAVIAIILNLIRKPLFMVGALVVVNVVFPILFFAQWFSKSSNYDSLDQDDDEHDEEEDFQFSVPKARQ